MIQTFVVLYSILIYAGGTDYEEAISHGLHFGSYEECNLFFNKNQKHLLAGAEDYGERRYNYDMEVILIFSIPHQRQDNLYLVSTL